MANDFLTTYTPLANDIAGQTGVNPAVVLGIIDTETGSGQHVVGNNIFGITPPGGVARYPDVQTAAQTFVNLMKTPRYAAVAQAGDPASQAVALVRSGYNTVNPNYAQLVASKALAIGKQLGYQGQDSGDTSQASSNQPAPDYTNAPAAPAAAPPAAPTSAKAAAAAELSQPTTSPAAPAGTAPPAPTSAKAAAAAELSQPPGAETGPPPAKPQPTLPLDASIGPDGSYVPPEAQPTEQQAKEASPLKAILGLPNKLTPEQQEQIRGNTPLENVLQAAKEGWQGSPSILTPAARQQVEQGPYGTVGRYLLNPLLDTAGGILAAGGAAFRGAQQFGYETLAPYSPGLAREVAALPEAFPLGGHELGTGFVPAEPATAQAARNVLGRRLTVADITDAIRRSDANAGVPPPSAPGAAAPPLGVPPAPVPEGTGLPPVAEGDVRLYHGGDPATEGAKPVTPDYQSASDQTAPGGTVHYVDVPSDHPAVVAATDAQPGQPPRVGAFNAPEDIAAQLRPVPGTEIPEEDRVSAGESAQPQPAAATPTHVWRSADYDYPVTPTGVEGTYSDGRAYAEVKQPDGTTSWVPKDELQAQPAGAQVTPGADIPDQTNLERARNLRTEINTSARDRAGPGLRDDTAYVTDVPGGVLPGRMLPERQFDAQTALDHKRRYASSEGQQYRAESDANTTARNTGMVDLLAKDAGDAGTLDAARTARREVAPDAFGAFEGEQPVDPSRLVNSINRTLAGREGKRGAVVRTLNSVLDQMQDADGNYETSPSQLYGVKQHVDDLLQKAQRPLDREGTDAAVAQIHLRNIKDQLDDLIQSGAPRYDAYREAYRQLSQPINQQRFLQRYQEGSKKLTNDAGDLQLKKVNQMLEDIHKGLTDNKPNLAKSLTDQQIQNVVNVRNELAAKQFADMQGRVRGSDSYQLFNAAAETGQGALGRSLKVAAEMGTHAALGAAVVRGTPIAGIANALMAYDRLALRPAREMRRAATRQARANALAAGRDQELLSRANPLSQY